MLEKRCWKIFSEPKKLFDNDYALPSNQGDRFLSKLQFLFLHKTIYLFPIPHTLNPTPYFLPIKSIYE